MAIYRWESGSDLIFIQNKMSELFEYALNQLKVDLRIPSPWTPPCDIYETEACFVLKAETPGVRLEDIFLEINGNVVLLAGERKRRREVNEENYQQIERSYGRFVRSFTLPSPVKESEVTASLTEGVLTVNIPKDKEKRGKVIRVNIKE